MTLSVTSSREPAIRLQYLRTDSYKNSGFQWVPKNVEGLQRMLFLIKNTARELSLRTFTSTKVPRMEFKNTDVMHMIFSRTQTSYKTTQRVSCMM